MQNDWTSEMDDLLSALWAQGKSASQIAAEISLRFSVLLTKNSIIGRRRRIGQEARQSPINRSGGASPRAKQKPAAAASTPVGGPSPRTATVLIPLVRMRDTAAAPAEPVPPAFKVVPRVAPARKPVCCWPEGEPGTKSFRFCEALALLGRPYCEKHAKRAYTNFRRPADVGDQQVSPA
jgi:GcrA cell cycle regulator